MNGRTFVILLGLTGLATFGATCKGSAPEKADTKPAPAKPAPEKPLVKAPAVTEIPGVSIRSIPPGQRADAVRLLNETYSYCGCARSAAACLQDRASCSCVESSQQMANFVVAEYMRGASTDDVAAQLLEGFSQGFNAKPIKFDGREQPKKGSDQAKVVLVEFADFRCSHCAAAKPKLDKLIAKHPEVRLEYFYFPLTGGGELSIRAAEAAEAARQQGKFWEMATLLFQNQNALSEEAFAGFAGLIGLDMAAFNKAMKTKANRL